MDERPLLVARETFGPLNLSDTTGYALIAAGTFPLPVRKVGGRWMVMTRDLREYLGLAEHTHLPQHKTTAPRRKSKKH